MYCRRATTACCAGVMPIGSHPVLLTLVLALLSPSVMELTQFVRVKPMRSAIVATSIPRAYSRHCRQLQMMLNPLWRSAADKSCSCGTMLVSILLHFDRHCTMLLWVCSSQPQQRLLLSSSASPCIDRTTQLMFYRLAVWQSIHQWQQAARPHSS